MITGGGNDDNWRKNTRSPSRGEQVPSDPSLGWSFTMITEASEDVNQRVARAFHISGGEAECPGAHRRVGSQVQMKKRPIPLRKGDGFLAISP